VKGAKYETVHKAIAWVILNRYNLNQDYWGGNESLERVCKHHGPDEFEYWKVDARCQSYPHDGYDDPSRGATIYFKTMQQDFEPTIIIGCFYFYKKLH